MAKKPNPDVQLIETRRCAATLVRALDKATTFQQAYVAVWSFAAAMDIRTHVLGDADFLELYQAALLRRGKTDRAASAGPKAKPLYRRGGRVLDGTFEKELKAAGKIIRVEEAPNVHDAHICEHLDMENGSTSPGDLVLCEACNDKLEGGAAVIGNGYRLERSGRGDWLKVQAKQAGK